MKTHTVTVASALATLAATPTAVVSVTQSELVANPPGPQIQPDGISFRDATSGAWTNDETANSDRRRLEFTNSETDNLVLAEATGGVFQLKPTSGLNVQPNRPRNPDLNFPEILLFKIVAMLMLMGFLVTGCASSPVKITPALVQQGVATGVAYSTAKYPQAVPYLKAADLVICSASEGTNLAPSEVVAAIESSDAAALKTPEAVLILNTALTLYTGVWDAYGADALNNQPDLKLYLQATCAGISDGLPPISLPTPITPMMAKRIVDSRGNPNWPHVKMP